MFKTVKMAESTREKGVEPRARMDGFSSTLSEYSTTLADMNKALEELQSRRVGLQSVLEGKQKQTANLRAQVDAQRVRERGWKEQENAALLRIKQLNEELDAAKQDLEKVRGRGEELRQLRLKKVSEFEEEMRELYSEFRCLQLLGEGEKGNKEENAELLSRLEKEVAELEEEHAALVADASTNGSLPLNTLQSILNEGSEYLKEIEKEANQFRDKEAALKQQLEALQQKADEAAPQQDVHMSEQ